MIKSENQFSFTRAAAINQRGNEKQLPLI